LFDLVLPCAEALGVAAGAARDCGHIGRLGEYAERAAERGLILLATVNNCGAGQRVAPPGGVEPRLGTNPLCAAVPTGADPVVLDFGTSVVAEGKVRVNFQKKEATPEGWLVDSTGKPTTDPSVLYTEPRGSILPFGGQQMYKGFGLGLLLDLLCGGLSGGPSSSPAYPLAGQGNAAVFVVFNPALFGGVEHFLQQTDGLTEYVRSCPRAEGVTEITLPGDPERSAKQKRLAEGVPIPDGTWELLAKAAGELNVRLPT